MRDVSLELLICDTRTGGARKELRMSLSRVALGFLNRGQGNRLHHLTPLKFEGSSLMRVSAIEIYAYKKKFGMSHKKE